MLLLKVDWKSMLGSIPICGKLTKLKYHCYPMQAKLFESAIRIPKKVKKYLPCALVGTNRVESLLSSLFPGLFVSYSGRKSQLAK